jgi:hypothetical protein
VSGFEVFDDFLGQHVGIGKIVGFFEAFVSGVEDVQAGFVAVDEFVVIIRAPRRCEKTPDPLILPSAIFRNSKYVQLLHVIAIAHPVVLQDVT